MEPKPYSIRDVARLSGRSADTLRYYEKIGLLDPVRREPQLRVHLGAALNVGVTPRELEEVVLQTVPYAGFPTAINAMNLLKRVLAEHGLIDAGTSWDNQEPPANR